MSIVIEPIKEDDDASICNIIKSVFEEHGINRPGTAYFDESLTHLSEAFCVKGSCYFVAKVDGKIVGGAGVFPTDGLPNDTCELVKMYLLPVARGQGLGKILIENCFDFARKSGYTRMYLETMPELKKAVAIYERLGFTLLPAALGNTGHHACTIYMLSNV